MSSVKFEKLPWSREAEVLLLELIREHRNVWDPKQPGYHKIKRRQEVFSQIASVIRQQFKELRQLTGEHVRMKFKNIRTYFQNLYRKIQKTPSGSAGQPGQKWPLFETAMFLVDSLVYTSNTTSTYVVPNSEQVNLVPTLCLSPDGSMREEEMPCLTTLDLQVTDCETVPSGEVTRLQQESSPQPSPGTSSSAEAGVPCHQKLPVRPTTTRKRKRPSSVVSDIDSCVETLQTYVKNINKKKSASVEASSLGNIVEATYDKLIHTNQIWFMQEVVKLVAKAKVLPSGVSCSCDPAIRKLDTSGESKSANLPSAEEFVDRFARIVEEHNLTSEQIYNADETGLFYRCLPRTTLASELEGDVKGFKQSKDRLTVLCCANMAGTHKVKLCVVGKHKKPRCFKNVNYLPVDYRNQRSAWMTAEIFLDWFKHCFVPSVKENLKKNGLPEDSKVILLIDNCRAHPPAEELVVGNIFAVYLPLNVTSVIQPMDQGVIQNFKMNYRKSFLCKLINYEDGTIPEFQKQFNVKDAIFMASFAWLDLKRQTLMRSWRKFYPLIMFGEEFEGFGGGMKNSVVSELREMGGNVQLKVTDEALREWVDVDENQAVTFTLTDEELINAVVDDHLEKISDDSDDDDNEPKVTWEQAAKHIAGFVRFAEQCTYMSTRDVMTLHCIENEFLLQRRKSCKQGDIRNYLACKGKEVGQTNTESDDVE